MTHEAAFLAAIAEHPEDSVLRLVYADWLDEHDEPSKAAFLRAECAPQTSRDHLRRIAEPLSGEWLAAVGRPRLIGTIWASEMGHDIEAEPGGEQFRFDPTGTVYYNARWLDEIPQTPQGPWRQVGSWVQFVVLHYQDGQPYSTLEGVVAGDRMMLNSVRRDGTSERLRLRRCQ